MAKKRASLGPGRKNRSIAELMERARARESERKSEQSEGQRRLNLLRNRPDVLAAIERGHQQALNNEAVLWRHGSDRQKDVAVEYKSRSKVANGEESDL